MSLWFPCPNCKDDDTFEKRPMPVTQCLNCGCACAVGRREGELVLIAGRAGRPRHNGVPREQKKRRGVRSKGKRMNTETRRGKRGARKR